MTKPYNHNLTKRFKGKLCLLTDYNRSMRDDCQVLYLKKNKTVKSRDDVVILGVITTFKDELADRKDRIVKYAATPGFGNVIFALSTMYLTDKSKSLLQSHELTEQSVRSTLQIIDRGLYKTNAHSVDEIDIVKSGEDESFKNIIVGGSPIEFMLEPDHLYLSCTKNHKESSISPKVFDEIVEDAEEFFWMAYENEPGDEFRKKCADNNHKLLRDFIKEDKALEM